MKKILVVDDSEVSLYLVDSTFEDDLDIKIIIEKDSTKALAKLKEHKPNVLLLDLMMPNINGFEIIDQIIVDPNLSNIPIIVISALLNDPTIEKLKNHGVKYYFGKPLELDELRKKVKELIK